MSRIGLGKTKRTRLLAVKSKPLRRRFVESRRSIDKSLPCPRRRLGRMLAFPFLLIAVVAFADPPTPSESVSLDEVTSAIIQRTNEFRNEHELPPVRRCDELTEAADQFARFMSKSDKYGHQADGRTPAERARAAGYQYCVVRENIAYRTNTGDPDTQTLIDVFVQGWIDSPSHRDNILADYVTDTGVAVATSDQVTFYAVQLFGRPKSKSIQIAVTNRSSQSKTLKIESNNTEDEIDLQPRMQVRLRRCFPTRLRLAEDNEALRVKDSGHWAITAGGLERDENRDR